MKTKLTQGKVSSNEDGAKAGRVEINVAEGEGVYPEPFDAVFMSGWCWPPEPGETVAGFVPDDEDQVEFADEVKWFGCIYDQENPVAEEFKEDYPKARGFKTKAGHLFFLNDKNGKEEITFKHKNGMMVSITKDGIFFGSQDAAEPVVLGELWKTMQSSFMQAFLDHKHPTGTGPSGPPLPPELTTVTNLKADVDGKAHLSDFIKAQKVKP